MKVIGIYRWIIPKTVCGVSLNIIPRTHVITLINYDPSMSTVTWGFFMQLIRLEGMRNGILISIDQEVKHQ